MSKLVKSSKIVLNLEVHLYKEDEYFVAFCPALNLSAYGDTKTKAKRAFETELNIFIEESHKKGTFEKYLLQQGWQLKQLPKPQYQQPPLQKLKKPSSKATYTEVFNTEIAIPCC
ncbi:MAG: hypothetical protein KGZ42_13330 [Melioribacter sp.]|nr:hypothetical protein [Melioribacter sp.]